MKIFEAANVITMTPALPSATHIAVKQGRIVGVGGPELTEKFANFMYDRQFRDDVIVPGFVEGHAHIMAGAMWAYAYCGYHERIDPEGQSWPGLPTPDAVTRHLQKVTAGLAGDQPVIGWGYDPIFMPGERLTRRHLDRISSDRPVAILYSNFHAMCVNSVALSLVGYTAGTDLEGLIKDENGIPTGELREMAAMFPVLRRLKIDFASLCGTETAIRHFGNVGKLSGVTTMSDLFSSASDADLAKLSRITREDDFPIRLYVALSALSAPAEEIVKRSAEMGVSQTDKLKLSSVKLMTDGSIQAFTARLRGGPYCNGVENGLWNMPPEHIHALCNTLHAHGIKMHIHVNGDEAAEISLDALGAAMKHRPAIKRRHVLQHCQLMDKELYARCARLGVAANIFSNHIWYFGDQHAAYTVGEARAKKMNACATALKAGVTIALHSDAPVTPLNPLFSMWCAVNRYTMSGVRLGEQECITPYQALHAITLGAAYTLDMEDDIGSIEAGKFADFAVLDQNPLEVSPGALKDINVKATVLSGKVFCI